MKSNMARIYTFKQMKNKNFFNRAKWRSQLMKVKYLLTKAPENQQKENVQRKLFDKIPKWFSKIRRVLLCL